MTPSIVSSWLANFWVPRLGRRRRQVRTCVPLCVAACLAGHKHSDFQSLLCLNSTNLAGSCGGGAESPCRRVLPCRRSSDAHESTGRSQRLGAEQCSRAASASCAHTAAGVSRLRAQSCTA